MNNLLYIILFVQRGAGRRYCCPASRFAQSLGTNSPHPEPLPTFIKIYITITFYFELVFSYVFLLVRESRQWGVLAGAAIQELVSVSDTIFTTGFSVYYNVRHIGPEHCNNDIGIKILILWIWLFPGSVVPVASADSQTLRNRTWEGAGLLGRPILCRFIWEGGDSRTKKCFLKYTEMHRDPKLKLTGRDGGDGVGLYGDGLPLCLDRLSNT